ncbi:penicillin-binding protein 1C [Alistipes sp.]|uniref:penicillin-binding protein 1C n=1 Tax=Alistipes sp. TaxID=1872444 RepID=UPI0025BE7A5E|nr:penicillin-binding protein 1C [Alistipes sp.]
MKYAAVTAAGILLLLWLFCLPRDLFEDTAYSTVVTDRNGQLLGARIADDGQWRFPHADSLPEKFVAALIEFEDRTFYRHIGVSVRALLRAAVQNIRSGRVVSGGSTISMQVIRLSRHKPRTLWQKMVEMFLATRLEARCSKEEILRLYAAHAPFGGNVVGIDAAMWRYLGNDGSELSWAEATTLAVLQNAPSSVHLSRNRDALLAKRNRLLYRLCERGCLSESEYELSAEEPLIGEPYPMPQYAPHWVENCNAVRHGERIRTPIDLQLQKRLEEVTARWSQELSAEGVNDLAAVVVAVKSGEVVAYCGNSDMNRLREGKWVDIARVPRSSGSILKPLLYCTALQEGTILPHTLLPDVPTDFGGFAPKNFDGTFAGAVPADEALSLSLNVPNVHLLKEYGPMRFAELLKNAGLLSLNKENNRYGLSLVLGGAEVRLLDIVQLYANMAACYQGVGDSTRLAHFPFADRVALYATFEAMRHVNRPDQMDWLRATSTRQIAWKTGTSYGSRDGWAIGVTPEYAVGVWAGNANGSSAPDLTGARTAGPVLFDVFNMLPPTGWFAEPDATDGIEVTLCRRSGHIAGRNCTETVQAIVPKNALKSRSCPYCQEAIAAGDRDTYSIERRFVLPPVMEHYYRQTHSAYQSATLTTAQTVSRVEVRPMHFIYPTDGCVVSLPVQGDGTVAALNCSVAHTDPVAEFFWHLDNSYLGSTRNIHQFAVRPSPGRHTLTVVDTAGNSISVAIVVV